MKKLTFLRLAICALTFYHPSLIQAQANKAVKVIPVGDAWANNSVNAVVFRKNSLVTFKDTQFIAYYDAQRYLVLGKRGMVKSQRTNGESQES